MNTEILCILDRSGSMASIKNDTIGGFNSFLKDQKEVEGNAKITLIQFDGAYEIVYQGVDIKEAPELNSNVFVPRGSTALLDAIGKTLTEQKARIQKEAWADKVIVVILTDGEENSSTTYNFDTIKTLTQSAQNDEWSFIYLGANQDAFSVASSFGIDTKSALNTISAYSATGVGVREASTFFSNTTKMYRMSK